MDWVLLAEGMVIGLAIAAPLGPVNLIAIRAVLDRGFRGGLAVGAGALTADASFAAIAVYGIRAVADLVAAYAMPISLCGGLLLVFMGVRMAVCQVTQLPSGTPSRSALAAASLTFTNPGALFGMLGIVGGAEPLLRLGDAPSRPPVTLAGIVIGGALWWIGLSLAVNLLRNKLSENALARVNRWSGVLVAAFGFVLIFQVFG
jgi:threonine/homoserine/homoserine lactone efflux protein